MPSRLVLLRVKLYICLLSSLSSTHFPVVFCTKVFRAFFFLRLPRVCIPPRPSGFIYATSPLSYGASSYVMSRVVPCFILMSVFWALFTRSQFVFLKISCQVSSQYCWNSFYISWCLLSYKAAIMITVCKQRGCIITVVTDSRLFCAVFKPHSRNVYYEPIACCNWLSSYPTSHFDTTGNTSTGIMWSAYEWVLYIRVCVRH